MPRLSSKSNLPSSVGAPGYDRSAASGIVHLGTGAFHRAHQAVYTDDAMAKSGGGWMITGVSLRSPDVANQLNPQDGLYTLLTRGPGGVEARVIGCIRHVLVARDEPARVLDALAARETKIVSLTITEKGYGLDPKTGGLDRAHPAVAADLAGPRHPQSAIGFIVEALRRRHEAGLAGFTVLSCDNLPANGRVTERLVKEFTATAAPEIAIGKKITVLARVDQPTLSARVAINSPKTTVKVVKIISQIRLFLKAVNIVLSVNIRV